MVYGSWLLILNFNSSINTLLSLAKDNGPLRTVTPLLSIAIALRWGAIDGELGSVITFIVYTAPLIDV